MWVGPLILSSICLHDLTCPFDCCQFPIDCHCFSFNIPISGHLINGYAGIWWYPEKGIFTQENSVEFWTRRYPCLWIYRPLSHFTPLNHHELHRVSILSHYTPPAQKSQPSNQCETCTISSRHRHCAAEIVDPFSPGDPPSWRCSTWSQAWERCPYPHHPWAPEGSVKPILV